MKRPQVTIIFLLFVVVVAAVLFAAIRTGSAGWAGALSSFVVFALICAPMGIVLGRGNRRVYWSGFALLGWCYTLLIYVPFLYDHLGHRFMAPQTFGWLEEHASYFGWPEARMLYRDMDGDGDLDLVVANGGIGFHSMRMMGGFGGTSGLADSLPIQQIALALEALLWATLGGWAARYFAAGPKGWPLAQPKAVRTEGSTGEVERTSAASS